MINNMCLRDIAKYPTQTQYNTPSTQQLMKVSVE